MSGQSITWLFQFSGLGVNALSRHGDLFECDWYPILALDVDGPGDVREANHLHTSCGPLGLFALAVPKNKTVSYLIVGTKVGELTFEAKDVSVWESRALISPYLSQGHVDTMGLEDEDLSTDTQSVRPEDRLRRLAGLYDEGLISSEEYSQQRAEILRYIGSGSRFGWNDCLMAERLPAP